jgi:hypothetical protein
VSTAAPTHADELVAAARALTTAWRRLAPASHPVGSFTDPDVLQQVLDELATAADLGEQVLHQLTAEADRLADDSGPVAEAADKVAVCLEVAAQGAKEQAVAVDVAATILDGGAGA